MAYSAKDITVLKGLEPVRERPGMYIGSTGLSGLHHLVYEVVDNAVDEAMAGYATRIDVTLLPDGACRVFDNGRGIPVDPHPEYRGKSAAEVVLTVLHAGGKFGGEGYKISGGLHGVGVSVVNALSSRLDLEVHRDGAKHFLNFANGGKVQGKLEKKGTVRGTGTIVTFWPDATIFEETEFRSQTLIERLREMAFLNKGLEIRFRDERVTPVMAQDFKFSGGITDFVRHLNASKEPLFKRVVAFQDTGEDYDVDIAMQWNTGYYEGIHSFANNIATTEGGMHEEGFRKALTNVLNKYARGKGLLKEKDENLLGEDIREGLTAIISVKLRNPQFEGQTKAKLGNTEMRSLVEKATNEKLADWFEEHPTEGRAAVAKATQAARARMAARQARDLTRRKSLLESSAMPGKLADCSSNRPEECEIFIVEGDSAGGSAKQARDPRVQAILPIRGKILNVERARLDKMLKNEEIQALVQAIGAGLGDEFDTDKLRYHKVILMSLVGDEPVLLADADGWLYLTEIGREVDSWLDWGLEAPDAGAVSVDADRAVRVAPLKQVIRHDYRGWVHRITSAYGRSLTVTRGHSVFVYEGGRLTTRPGDEIVAGDLVVAPRRLPRPASARQAIDLLETFVVNGLTRGLRVDGESVRRRNLEALAEMHPTPSDVGSPRVDLPVREWRRLASARRSLGITQQRMAEALELRQACTISEYETGRSRPTDAIFRAYLARLGEPRPADATLVPALATRWATGMEGSRNDRWRRAGPSCRADDLTIDDLFFLDDEVMLVPHAHRDRAVPRHLPITEDLCYFLGWFTAEGSLSRGSQVSLSLGDADEPYLASIVASIEAVFGETPRLHRGRDRAPKLYFGSTIAARLLVALGLGGRAHEKRLPDLLLNVSEAHQLAFLEGYFLGDGTKGNARTRLAWTTVSPALADGLVYLLGQLGVIASTSTSEGGANRWSDRVAFHVSVGGKDQLDRLAQVWRKSPGAEAMAAYAASPGSVNQRWIELSDDLVALPVRSNVARPHDGPVYDLSVADDHNFVGGTGGPLLAHNTDADVDGSHIRTLLMTFFYRQLPDLVKRGHVYIAQPPLFRADLGKERNYLKDESALRAFEAEHEGRKIEVNRFKGLGEMDWHELRETTMDPQTRNLLRVSVEDAAIADDIFSRLMGDDVDSRKTFIQENAKDVRFIDA